MSVITEAQLATVVEQLRKGRSLRKACIVAKITPHNLRVLRVASFNMRRRVDEARAQGLRDRAKRCRYVATQNGDLAVMLFARAREYEKRAAAIEGDSFIEYDVV